VVVFELNAANHSQRRAIANALALNAIQRDGRLPITTSANCLQPDGENDNGWDQGLLFLNPSQVWLQPPGYITRMMSSHFQPQLIQSSAQNSGNSLDVCAKLSLDSQTLVLQVVNLSSSPVPAAIHLDGFAPTNPIATVEALAGALSAVNTADNQQGIIPIQSQWHHGCTNGVARYTFASNSFSVIVFQGDTTPAPPPPPAPPPAVLTHRWSFNEPAGATSFVDSVLGSANGILHGAARLDGNGNLVLPGLNQNANYAELPPYLLNSSTYSAVTLEFWVAFGTNPQWGRLIDFGDTNPSTGNGRYCLDFTPHSGFSPNGVNFEVSGADPGYNSIQNIAMLPVLDNCGKIYLTLIWDSLAGYTAVYTNGILMAINNNVTLPMSAIVNSHSYLGKSSYVNDSCGVATIEEFRMFSGAMGAAQMAADLAAGPDALPLPSLTVAQAGQSIVFGWPGYIPGFSLQTSAVLGAGASWGPPPGEPAPVLSNGSYLVTIPMSNQTRFYRLIKY
jgi:hypothetical protein